MSHNAWVIWAAGALLLAPLEISATPVDTVSQDKVEGKCGESGGIFWPKTGSNPTYGCMNPDNSGIVCGGASSGGKKTCDSFVSASGMWRSRALLSKASHLEMSHNRTQVRR